MSENLEPWLIELANNAWRRQPEGGAFLLCSSHLPEPISIDNIRKTIALLYAQALIWASGLDIPSSIPAIYISSLHEENIAGQYSVANGEPQIVLAEKYFLNAKECLSILVHECCHHILDLSGLQSKDKYLNERKTDLLMFVCGYGQIVLEGFIEPDTSKGNLSYDESCYAYNWTKENHLKYRHGEGPVEGEASHLKKKFLLTLHGDRKKFDRIFKSARKKHDDMSEEQLLRWLLEDFYRDNR